MSGYLGSLPASFQADPFLGRFLLAFERILNGFAGPPPSDIPHATEYPRGETWFTVAPGIERILNAIQYYFIPEGPEGEDGEQAPADPAMTPPGDFLSWLATWVGVSLRDGWDTETRRRFLQGVPALYRMRGTRECMQQVLELYLPPGSAVRIVEPDSPPNYFEVYLTASIESPELLSKYDQVARALIDQEKPAHTFYSLTIGYPMLQILLQTDPPLPPDKGVRVGGVVDEGGGPKLVGTTVLGTGVFTRRPPKSR